MSLNFSISSFWENAATFRVTKNILHYLSNLSSYHDFQLWVIPWNKKLQIAKTQTQLNHLTKAYRNNFICALRTIQCNYSICVNNSFNLFSFNLFLFNYVIQICTIRLWCIGKSKKNQAEISIDSFVLDEMENPYRTIMILKNVSKHLL